MIGVLGEAVIDLIRQPDGRYRAFAGGSPFNVAMALGRQSCPATYLSPLSDDDFGELLAKTLERAGVLMDINFRSPLPTSLAVVALNESGQPRYRLYREGIADRDYSVDDILSRIPPGLALLHTGSLAITPSELPRVAELFKALRGRGILICMDLNMRPGVVKEMSTYVEGVRSLLSQCDILKGSDEDLELLGYEGDRSKLVDELRNEMEEGVVAITFGEHGALIANEVAVVERQSHKIDNIGDTVGAGDCFQAGMLAALHQGGLLNRAKLNRSRAEVLDLVLQRANASAALNVMQAGCQPPSNEEVMQFLEAER